ncbi:MAG: peptide chain release factor 1 [Bacteroidales bacterium]|nr:peptide chain release factor 1 [Bacteroidales bacterium]
MSNNLIDRLETLRLKFEELSQQISDPSIIADQKKYVVLNREYRNLEKIVIAFKEYKNLVENREASKQILELESDQELRDMARYELDDIENKIPEMEEIIKILLIPKDPNDNKNAILEIRAGSGGDEASIFAGDLFRMYSKFIEKKNWKMSLNSCTEGTSGGFKEVIVTVEGDGVYGELKYESGVHRVQRVPQTESQGRVHTSAATVAVLPEAEEIDFVMNMGDIRKDTFRASGAGGQHINKTESAIRLTHLPTNTVVECQDGRSQHANYDQALKVLRSRLYEKELKKQHEAISAHRKSLVGSGDRSDKIRTYNYPQGRITDHRINLTLYNLAAVVDGEIQEIIDKLIMEENTERLKDSL